MNRLITTHNGGMPDHLDNFRWHEQAVKETLHNICRGLANGAQTGLRLWGANITETATHYQVSRGAIYFEGEIFYVPEHTLQKFMGGTSGTYLWDIHIGYDPAGNLDFENGQSHGVYEIRQARLIKTTQQLTPGSFIQMNCPRFDELWTLKSHFNDLSDDFNTLKSQFNTLKNNTGTAYFYKQIPSMPQSYQNHQNIQWGTKAGTLVHISADILLKNGGVYLVRVIQGGSSSGLRLRIGSIFSSNLSAGDNIIRPPSLGSDFTANFQHQVDDTFEIYVILLAVAPLGQTPSAPPGSGL